MTDTLKLYESRAQIEAVDIWIADHPDELLANGGALPSDLAQLLDAAEGAFEEKAERVALRVQELEAEEVAISMEACRLRNRANATGNAAKSLKEYLKRHMEAVGLATVKGTLATLTIQPNPPAVKGPETQEELGIVYRRQRAEQSFVFVSPITYVLDKKRVLEAHKAGVPLPTGFTVTRGSSLRIR